jgi:hypothetical protein
VLESGFRVPDALSDGLVNLMGSGEDVTGVNEKRMQCLRAVPGRGGPSRKSVGEQPARF